MPSIPVAAHTAVSTAGSDTVQPALLPTLQQGDSGSAVSLWQKDLNAFINSPPPSCRPTLAVDGAFGPLTTAATKCFQSATFFTGSGTLGPVTPDGIVGPVTRGKMCTFLARGFTSLHNQTCT